MKAKLFHFKCSNKWINEKVLLPKCICFRVRDNLLFLPEKPERASGYRVRATKSRLIRKDPDAGKDWRQEEKGMAEDEVVGWHHQFEGHEFAQALGVGDGQGSLVCCSPRGPKELDTTERLNSWTTKDLGRLQLNFDRVTKEGDTISRRLLLKQKIIRCRTVPDTALPEVSKIPLPTMKGHCVKDHCLPGT